MECNPFEAVNIPQLIFKNIGKRLANFEGNLDKASNNRARTEAINGLIKAEGLDLVLIQKF